MPKRYDLLFLEVVMGRRIETAFSARRKANS